MGNRRTEAISILAVILLAAAPLLLWFSLNQSYPDGDNSDYTWQALRIARRFLSDGFVSGLTALYPIRTRKEIIHPLLAVPGFLLSGGRVLSGQFLSMVLIFSMFSVSAYALARVYLQRLDSVLATAVMAAIPWVSDQGHNLNAELPFTALFIASWAAILRTDGLQRKWPTVVAAVLTGLSACARPAESVVLFVPTLTAYFLFLLKSTNTPWKELRNSFFCVATVVLSLVAVWFTTRLEPTSDDSANWKAFWFVAGLLGLAWLLYFRVFRTTATSKIQIFGLVATSTALLWFAPVFPNVVNWIISCSYQNGVGMNPERVGFWNMWAIIKSSFSGPYTPALFVVAAIVYRGAYSRRGAGVPWLAGALAALIGVCAIHFLLGMRSYNIWWVYYFPEIACLYLGVFVAFLSSQWLKWPKRAVMAALLLTEFFTFAQAYGALHNNIRVPAIFHSGPMELPLRIEDPALTFFRQIEPDFEGRSKIRVAIDHRDLNRFWGLLDDLEYIQLRLIALEHSHTVEFTIWGPSDRPLPDDADFYLSMVGHSDGPEGDDQLSILKIKGLGFWKLIPVKSTSGPGKPDLVDGTVLWVKRR